VTVIGETMIETFRTQEAEFVLPATPQDQTINMLGFFQPALTGLPPADAPPEFSLVISRDLVDTHETVDAFVDRQMQAMETGLPGFALLSRSGLRIDGASGVHLVYTWQSENGPLFQRQACLHCPPEVSPNPKTRLMLTITGTSAEALQARYETPFNQFLYSLQFRR
jgi:hypothetical protein